MVGIFHTDKRTHTLLPLSSALSHLKEQQQQQHTVLQAWQPIPLHLQQQHQLCLMCVRRGRTSNIHFFHLLTTDSARLVPLHWNVTTGVFLRRCGEGAVQVRVPEVTENLVLVLCRQFRVCEMRQDGHVLNLSVLFQSFPLMYIPLQSLTVKSSTLLYSCRYVYERLTPKGKRPGFPQLFATQMTSALWHGLSGGQALFFASTALSIQLSGVIYNIEQGYLPRAVATSPLWFLLKLAWNQYNINYLVLAFHVSACYPGMWACGVPHGCATWVAMRGRLRVWLMRVWPHVWLWCVRHFGASPTLAGPFRAHGEGY